MNLTFGLHLDASQGQPRETRLNGICCGPLGLVDVLETRLGLKVKLPSQAQRIGDYHSLLEALAGSREVFYAESFRKDPYAVAETLLRWRDDLIEAGWNGGAEAADSRRIQDLAAIESQVSGRVVLGLPDRAKAILNEVRRRPAGIETFTVLDPPEHLPWVWRQISDALGAHYSPVNTTLGDRRVSASTDLAVVQASLTGQTPGSGKATGLKRDGSILCLTAQSEFTLAFGVAQYIRKARTEGRSSSLVAGAHMGLLRQALLALNEPSAGLDERSVARPILQVLGLALRLYWKPLDPRALLEFLTHAACPVTGLLRSPLARAVAESPGIGGPPWQEAIKEAKANAAKRYQDDPAALANALERIDEDLRHWLLVERFDPAIGAAAADLCGCCGRVARWAMARAEAAQVPAEHKAHFQALAALSTNLAALLRPRSTITRSQLERLEGQVGATGWTSDTGPELGHIHWVDSPAAIIEPADAVVWWDFSEPVPVRINPWTASELEQLAARGVRFLSPEVLATRESESWLRPVLAARAQLILAHPRQRGGDPVTQHPLHARLLSVLGTDSLPTIDLDREMQTADPAAGIVSAERAHRPLPGLRRWWKLGSGDRLAPREEESYSSAEKFVYSPYAWVLRYRARLKAGPLANQRLQDDHRQKGTLLHRVLDLVLAAPPTALDWRQAPPAALERWIEEQWPVLLEQEAANLLLPGNRSEAARLLATAKTAMTELVEQLRAAKVVHAQSNVAPEARSFAGGRVSGIIDLLVDDGRGRIAVVDLKYGGRAIREKELAQNRQLQLAVYGYLLRSASGTWPEAAFYILGDRRLLAQSAGYFPRCRVFAPPVNSGLAQCWAEFETVWQWRRRQLDAGWIELTVEGAEGSPGSDPPPGSVPPAPHWQAAEDQDKFNEFDALTGWRADA